MSKKKMSFSKHCTCAVRRKKDKASDSDDPARRWLRDSWCGVGRRDRNPMGPNHIIVKSHGNITSKFIHGSKKHRQIMKDHAIVGRIVGTLLSKSR